jgi:hypothetical protein
LVLIQAAPTLISTLSFLLCQRVKENLYSQERESPQYKKLMMKEHMTRLMRRRKRRFPLQLLREELRPQLRARTSVNTRAEVVVEEAEETTVASSASITPTMKGSRSFVTRKLTISTILPADNVVVEADSGVALEAIEESTGVAIVAIVANAAEAAEEAVGKDHGLNVSTEVVGTSGKPSSTHLRGMHQYPKPLSHNPPHSINES